MAERTEIRLRLSSSAFVKSKSSSEANSRAFASLPPPARLASYSASSSKQSACTTRLSPHTVGTTYFQKDVDTIFEIGGQDAKYVLINNGVPIDYAMNEACSAGDRFLPGGIGGRGT